MNFPKIKKIVFHSVLRWSRRCGLIQPPPTRSQATSWSPTLLGLMVYSFYKIMSHLKGPIPHLVWIPPCLLLYCPTGNRAKIVKIYIIHNTIISYETKARVVFLLLLVVLPNNLWICNYWVVKNAGLTRSRNNQKWSPFFS